MAAGARIVWSNAPEILTGRLVRLAKIFPQRVDEACAASALHGEAYARMNAPWSNRTGAARASLRGESTVKGASGEITVGHGVDYGIWLEVANAGRYGIIPQTMQSTVADLQGRLNGLLGAAA